MSEGIQDITVEALAKFFRDEAKVSEAQALEAAEAVIEGKFLTESEVQHD
jgi:hypothetical protein